MAKVYITKAHRKFILSWCESSLQEIAKEIEDMRYDLHSTIWYARQLKDKEPKRSDFNPLLPSPEIDYAIAWNTWNYNVNLWRTIVLNIRLLQVQRKTVLELEERIGRG